VVLAHSGTFESGENREVARKGVSIPKTWTEQRNMQNREEQCLLCRLAVWGKKNEEMSCLMTSFFVIFLILGAGQNLVRDSHPNLGVVANQREIAVRDSHRDA